MLYDQGLFHSWVPKYLRIILSILIATVIASVSAVYRSNIGIMYSGLGTEIEAFTFSYYATFIGMILGMSMLIPIRRRFRPKEILMTCIVGLIIINLVFLKVSNPVMIAVLSVVVGFFKMFGIISFAGPLIQILTPERDRRKFYPIFYPAIIGGIQFSSYTSALISYDLDWRFYYLIVAMALLVCLIIVAIVANHKRTGHLEPMKNVDWFGRVLLLVLLLLLDYVLVFAKQQYWFHSDRIKLFSGFIVLGGVVWFAHLLYAKDPMFQIRNYARKNVIMVGVIVTMMGIYLAASKLQTSLFTVLNYTQIFQNRINLWVLPGMVFGSFFSIFIFKRFDRLKILFFCSLGCFQLYVILLYFFVTNNISADYFILPAFIKGCAMCMTYIGLGVYFAELPFTDFIKGMPMLVIFRSFVTVAFFSAIYSWSISAMKQESMHTLASQLDSADTLAQHISYGGLSVQAALSSIKRLLGSIVILGFCFLAFILVFPFKRMSHRKLVLFKRRFSLRSNVGYRYHHEAEPLKPIRTLEYWFAIWKRRKQKNTSD